MKSPDSKATPPKHSPLQDFGKAILDQGKINEEKKRTQAVFFLTVLKMFSSKVNRKK